VDPDPCPDPDSMTSVDPDSVGGSGLNDFVHPDPYADPD
jgi:hypothetical protein